MSALVFQDTETCGLAVTDDIWEFAGIRREASGAESEIHLFIEHDEAKCALLPPSFRDDHYDRFPTHSHDLDVMAAAGVTLRPRAARLIGALYHDRPHVAGAVPNFDTDRIEGQLLVPHGVPDRWHHHLIDVESLAVGYLAATGIAVPRPWNSDDLSRAVGVEPPVKERHTAMGDTRWAMALHDRITWLNPTAVTSRCA